MPSTISFDRQFELPLVTAVGQGHNPETFTTAPLSGTYEVTSTRDGDWHISDLWLTLDNGRTGFHNRTIPHPLKPGTALWDAIADLITAHYREAIEETIEQEISQ
jgi:hypothetical protein